MIKLKLYLLVVASCYQSDYKVRLTGLSKLISVRATYSARFGGCTKSNSRYCSYSKPSSLEIENPKPWSYEDGSFSLESLADFGTTCWLSLTFLSNGPYELPDLEDI